MWWSNRSEEVASIFTIIQSNVDAGVTKSGESCSANTVLVRVGCTWSGVGRLPESETLNLSTFNDDILSHNTGSLLVGISSHPRADLSTRAGSETRWGNWPASRSYPFAISLYLFANSNSLDSCHGTTWIPAFQVLYRLWHWITNHLVLAN